MGRTLQNDPAAPAGDSGRQGRTYSHLSACIKPVCGCSSPSEIFGVTRRPCLPQHTIRALALRVLKEILRNQPARFKNYAELTIMKTLEAHKDSHKEVNRCVSVHPVVSLHGSFSKRFSRCFPVENCCNILSECNRITI